MYDFGVSLVYMTAGGGAVPFGAYSTLMSLVGVGVLWGVCTAVGVSVVSFELVLGVVSGGPPGGRFVSGAVYSSCLEFVGGLRCCAVCCAVFVWMCAGCLVCDLFCGVGGISLV